MFKAMMLIMFCLCGSMAASAATPCRDAEGGCDADTETLLQTKTNVEHILAVDKKRQATTCTDDQKSCPGYWNHYDGTQMPDMCYPSDMDCPLVCDPFTTQYCWTEADGQFCGDVHTPCPAWNGKEDCDAGTELCPGMDHSKDCGPDLPPLPAFRGWCTSNMDWCHQPATHGCCSTEKWCTGPDGSNGPGECHPKGDPCPRYPVTCEDPTPKVCPGHYDYHDGTQMTDTCHSDDYECPIVCNPWTEQYCWDQTNMKSFCGDVHTPCPVECPPSWDAAGDWALECPGTSSRDCGDHPPIPAYSGWCTDNLDNCHTYTSCCWQHEKHCWEDNGPGYCVLSGEECVKPPAATSPPPSGPCPDSAFPKACPGYYNLDGTQMPETCHAEGHECPLVCDTWTHQMCWDHATQKSSCHDVHSPCPAHCESGLVECPGGLSRDCGTSHPPMPATQGYCEEFQENCFPHHAQCCPNEQWCMDADPAGPGSCHPADGKCPELPTLPPQLATLPPLKATVPPPVATVPPVPARPTQAPATCDAGQKSCTGYWNWDGTQQPATCHPEDSDCPLVCDPWTHQYCWNEVTYESFCGDVHTPCPMEPCGEGKTLCPGVDHSKDCGPEHPPLPAQRGWCTSNPDWCGTPSHGCCASEKWCMGVPNGPSDCALKGEPCPRHPVNCSVDFPDTPKNCPGHYDYHDGTQMTDTCHREDHECPLVCNPWTEQFCWDSVNHKSFCGEVHTPCPVECPPSWDSTGDWSAECPGTPSKDCGAHPPIPAYAGWCTDNLDNCHTYTSCCWQHEKHCWEDNGPGYCVLSGEECVKPPAATSPPPSGPCPDSAFPKACPGYYNSDGTQMPETCHAEGHECPLVCDTWTHQMCWDHATQKNVCHDVHSPCPAHCDAGWVECPGGISRDCGTSHPPIPATMGYCMDSLEQCYPQHVHCCPNEQWCMGADQADPGSCHPADGKCPELPTLPPQLATLPPLKATVPPPAATEPPLPTHPPGTAPPHVPCPAPCYCLAPHVACDDGNGHQFCHAAPCPVLPPTGGDLPSGPAPGPGGSKFPGGDLPSGPAPGPAGFQ